MIQDSKPPDSQVSLHSFLVQLVAVTLLINLFVAAIAGWSLYGSKRQYEERAAVANRNTAVILERYLCGVIEKVDLTLRALADETERQLAIGGIEHSWLNLEIARQEARLPELDSLRVANASGDIVYGTGLVAGKLANVADRDYFRRLRDDPKSGLIISRPVIGVISKQWVVMLARRLNNPDGSFAGAIYGVIPLDHFRSMFSSIDGGETGTVTLCDQELRVVVRVPGVQAPESYVGKKLVSRELHQMVQSGRESGNYEVVSSLDDIKRIYSFRKLDGYPLYIFIGRGQAEYLAPWRSEAANMMGMVACFSAVSVVSSSQIYKRRKREKQAEAELHRYHDFLEDIVAERTSELQARNRELRESEALLKTLIENVYDGIVIHDRDGRIVQVNDRWLKMFGLDQDEIGELTVSEISAEPPPLQALVSFWAEVLAGESKLFEWRSRRPNDDSLFDAEVFVHPIKFKGEDMVMACIRDITERKRVTKELQEYRDELERKVEARTADLAKAIEETRMETARRVAAVEELRRKEQLLIQQSRLAAMGEMLANIAHQWRQPLNLLGLIVQELNISYKKGVLSEELLDTRVVKAMEVIKHMSRTIDDFRNLLSPDKVQVTFCVNEVVEKALSMLQPHAKVDVVAEEECFAKGTRNEYSQVIINIISNAHDVFRERQIQDPRVAIRIFRNKERSVVTVADNGGGIPDENIEKIFDPYFTTKGPDKGTGLGLFMSKTIIEKSMKGSLTVRNTAEGAEFRIEV